MKQLYNPLTDQLNLVANLPSDVNAEPAGTVATAITNLKAPIVVNTITEAISLTTLTNGQRIYITDTVRGGDFYWNATDTATEDNGIVFKLSSNTTNTPGRIRRVIQIQGSFLNALWFGLKTVENGGSASDAINNASAINKALSVGDVFIPPNSTFYLPLSRPTSGIISPTADTVRSGYSGVLIPNGRSLIGFNQQTTKAIAAPTTTVEATACLVACQSNSTLSDIWFDGNKANVTGSGSWSNWLVRAAPNKQTNIVIRNCIVSNVASSDATQESFGFSFYTATNSSIIDCEVYGVSGTGLHFDGDYIQGIFNSNNKVVRLRSHDNGILVNEYPGMGMSIYGTKDVIVENCDFYNNGGHGLNLEWVENARISGIRSWNNNSAGLGTFGQIINARIYDSEFSGNAVTIGNNEKAEIVIRGGSWYRAATGQPNPPKGIAYTMEFHNCNINPLTTRSHFAIKASSSNTAGGVTTSKPILSQPYQILINCQNAENWTYVDNDGLTINGGFVFKGINLIPTKTSFKAIQNWSGNLTSIAYSGTETSTNNAVIGRTLSATIQYQNLSHYIEAGKTYILSARFIAPDKLWSFYLQKSSTSVKYLKMVLPSDTIDSGQWFYRQWVIKTPPDGTGLTDWQIVIVSESVGSSSITFAEINLQEAVSAGSTILGFPEQVTAVNINPFTLTGTNTSTTLKNVDSGSGGSIFYIDGSPINNTQSMAVALGRNSNASDCQFNIYKTNTSTILHNLSASDSFLAMGTANLGIGMDYQEGANEKLCVKGYARVQGSTTPGIKFAANVFVKLAADATPGSTSISLLSNNGSNLRLSTNTLLTFGTIKLTVTSGTTINPTTGTLVPISGTISSTIVTGTVSSGFSARSDSDRWNIELDGVSETGSNVGSNLRITRWNDAGSNNTNSGGASLGTVLTIRRSDGGVEIPLLKATTQTITSATIGTSGNTDFLTVLGNFKLQQGTNTYTRFQSIDGGSGGDALFYIDPIPQASSNNCEIRFFRLTNALTSSISVYKGDNTNTINSRIGGTGSSYFNLDNGNFGIGTNNPTFKFDLTGSFRHQSGNIGFYGKTPVAQQTGGVATAAASYTTNEQGMIQRMYDALRAYGLLT